MIIIIILLLLLLLLLLLSLFYKYCTVKLYADHITCMHLHCLHIKNINKNFDLNFKRALQDIKTEDGYYILESFCQNVEVVS